MADSAIGAVPALGGGGGAVSSVNTQTGAVVLAAADVGAAPASGISPSAITGTAVVTADSRLSDARTPTAHKASHATGGSDALAAGDLAPGVIAGTAVVTADARLSDARTPTAHATSHKTGGSDAVKLDELAAPTDITTLNASTLQHGLLPKLGGGTANFLRADGSWAAPGGSAFSSLGPGTFANMPPMLATTSIASPNAGDARFLRVQMAMSGTLHDVSFLCGTTGGNYNIIVMDDGQANATHTTRTALYIKGSTATPAGGTWMTGDAALAVNAGDTLVFMLTFDGTTAKAVSAAGSSTGVGTLPTSSFFPGSGASTASQKLMGTVLSANVPTTTSGAGSTVTDANFATAVNFPLVVWRIS